MQELTLQGRRISLEDREQIQSLLSANPGWSRRRLSQELCELWNWRNGAGQIKDMAARSLLLKLEQRGLVKLPARRQRPGNRMRDRKLTPLLWDAQPIEGGLGSLGDLQVQEVSRDGKKRAEFFGALSRFHYLGCGGTVGENLQYQVSSEGRSLAYLLFGSSAWKCKARDQWIGWNQDQRERNLNLTTNNTRFLILPWVKVPHLGSWILGRVNRRLSGDWQTKYGHPIRLVETFVERERFKGTVYRAANWVKVGSTTGRTRQDRDWSIQRPVKDIYVYPLEPAFRRRLCV